MTIIRFAILFSLVVELYFNSRTLTALNLSILQPFGWYLFIITILCAFFLSLRKNLALIHQYFNYYPHLLLFVYIISSIAYPSNLPAFAKGGLTLLFVFIAPVSLTSLFGKHSNLLKLLFRYSLPLFLSSLALTYLGASLANLVPIYSSTFPLVCLYLALNANSKRKISIIILGILLGQKRTIILALFTILLTLGLFHIPKVLRFLLLRFKISTQNLLALCLLPLLLSTVLFGLVQGRNSVYLSLLSQIDLSALNLNELSSYNSSANSFMAYQLTSGRSVEYSLQLNYYISKFPFSLLVGTGSLPSFNLIDTQGEPIIIQGIHSSFLTYLIYTGVFGIFLFFKSITYSIFKLGSRDFAFLLGFIVCGISNGITLDPFFCVFIYICINKDVLNRPRYVVPAL